MTQNAAKKVQEYKDSLKKKAEDLVLNGFPEKIMKLNDLLETPAFCNRNLSEIHQELNVPVPDPIIFNNKLDNSLDAPSAKKSKMEDGIPKCGCEGVGGTRVLLLPTGIVPCNKTLCELINIVKPHIRQLVEDANMVKMWISYMIPKIEDGNNFGVSIQEETLAEVTSVESEGAVFFDQISRYFISRGKVVSKVAKYPHIEDYRRSVSELDEKQYLSLWLVMCEIRNRYCTLHDLVVKNLEKIKKPRSENAQALY